MNYEEWKKKRLSAVQDLRETLVNVRRDYAMPGFELSPSRFTVCVRQRPDGAVSFTDNNPLWLFVADRTDETPTRKKIEDLLPFELEFFAYVQQIVNEWERGVRQVLPPEREVIEGFTSRFWDGPLRPGKSWVDGEMVKD